MQRIKPMVLLLEISGVLAFLVFIWFGVVSFQEKETLALKRSFFLSILFPILFFGCVMLSMQGYDIPGLIFLLSIAFFLLSILLPIRGKNLIKNEIPKARFDERDTMFSRLEISGSNHKKENYYQNNPKKLDLDRDWHQKPGLMSSDSAMYSPITFKAADASFFTIEQLRPFVDGEVCSEKEEFDPEKMSVFIDKWAKKLGAVSVGFCELQDHHYYSFRGRGEAYGKEVVLSHKYGIALTVEMDKEFLATGPAGPTLMESARQYLNSGVIAIQIAKYIRELGYGARAHIDGNYEVICPLVGRDAGLGEIGRMGLLMTPELGARIRIAVVTTNMPLHVKKRNPDVTVKDFCGICKKCAIVCPSNAIPKTSIEMHEGVERWRVNHEKCFGYWCSSGTDCGRCMSVCPYSHPDNLLHNVVRWGIKNNWLFRRFALVMDDFFYGKKPKPAKVPNWINFTKERA